MQYTNHAKYYIKELTKEETVAAYRENGPLHFPKDELKPVSSIEWLYGQNAYLGLGLFEAASPSIPESETASGKSTTDRLLGYALFLTPPGQSTVLLDYYAILEEYRDLGLGSFFLQGMKPYLQNADGILIETENPAFAPNEKEALLRNRRNAFYARNGGQPTNVFCSLFGVPYQIHFLSTKTGPAVEHPAATDITGEASSRSLDVYVRTGLEAIYRFMLPEEVYQKNVVWS